MTVADELQTAGIPISSTDFAVERRGERALAILPGLAECSDEAT